MRFRASYCHIGIWLLAGLPGLGDDWPQWLGPNRDGIARGHVAYACLFAASLLAGSLETMPDNRSPDAAWTIFIANDTCPDYTWGNSEVQTRQNFAELIRSHLDEMTRTDSQPGPNQNRYNMAVTLEALCFVEKYPERKAELIRRLKEGRIFMSPFLCNTLWGFQSTEGFLRSLYPARRLEREWELPKVEVAHHIEHPALPWGVTTLLAGCGIRWVSVPFLDYDCTFGRLQVPPVFVHEGPDGSQLRVILDTFGSKKANYTQGAHLLNHPGAITNEWLPHYRQLGSTYPIPVILASGTHGDTHAHSAGQARRFADQIIAFNAGPESRPKLMNATLPQFCQAVDAAQANKPFLKTVRGCFGHSWDLWPVSLGRYAAEARTTERRFLAAEAMLALAGVRSPVVHERSRAVRERAEWNWAMLSDHAWNGSNDRNRDENARLRREWVAAFAHCVSNLNRATLSWSSLGVEASQTGLVVFNSESPPRSGLVRLAGLRESVRIKDGETELPGQIVQEDGESVLYFVSPEVSGFGLRQFEIAPDSAAPAAQAAIANALGARATGLESPFYSLVVDPPSGGLRSLVHKPTGTELVVNPRGRLLGQTSFFDGQEQTLTDVKSEVVAVGPVLARLRITGSVAGIRVTHDVTVYAQLDHVDFEFRIHKPVSTQEQRLCQTFPVVRGNAQLRVETTGAVLRPDPQPRGDLFPGSDPNRFAVQGFVDASTADFGVTLATLDAFVLRRDLGDVTFEALGNDQNHREVSKDQGGMTDFRFRYALRAHDEGYDNATAIAWSRSMAFPLLAERGLLTTAGTWRPHILLDPARAIATCLKPADGNSDGGCILRLWEVGGKSGTIRIGVEGFRRVFRTDLLERDLEELPVEGLAVKLDLAAGGFGSLRLSP